MSNTTKMNVNMKTVAYNGVSVFGVELRPTSQQGTHGMIAVEGEKDDRRPDYNHVDLIESTQTARYFVHYYVQDKAVLTEVYPMNNYMARIYEKEWANLKQLRGEID